MRTIRFAQTMILMLVVGLLTFAQTQVDLKTQARNVDFSGASATKPVKAGSLLPPGCAVGEMFFKTDAIAGQNLHLCVGLNTWTQIQGNGSTGGGGSTSASGLADFQTVRVNSTMLSIGSGCGLSTPCVASWGNRSVSITVPAFATISAGSGVAFLYLSVQGAITVGHTMSVSCSGCVAVSGVTAFPPDSIPLATWSSLTGVWEPNGGLDLRGYLTNKPVGAGVGLTSTDIAGETVLHIDPSVVATRVSVPASSSANCSIGSYAIDADFFYACVALNSWKRVAITNW